MNNWNSYVLWGISTIVELHLLRDDSGQSLTSRDCHSFTPIKEQTYKCPKLNLAFLEKEDRIFTFIKCTSSVYVLCTYYVSCYFKNYI